MLAETEADDPFSPISFYTMTSIDITCKYPLFYDISQSKATDNLNSTTDSTTGEGSFDFSIDLYTDQNFNSIQTTESLKSGNYLYFQVNPTQEMPNGVEYAVQSCRVVNTNQDIAYRFYEDGCENSRVSASRYNHASFSYRLFGFGQDSVSNVALSCQVNVCLGDLEGTSCKLQETGSCAGGESWVETNVNHLL